MSWEDDHEFWGPDQERRQSTLDAAHQRFLSAPLGAVHAVLLPLRQEGSKVIFPQVSQKTIVRSIVSSPVVHGVYLLRMLPALPEFTPLGHLTPAALHKASVVLARLEPGLHTEAELRDLQEGAYRMIFSASAVGEQAR